MTVPKRDIVAPCVLLVEPSREQASAMRRTLEARGSSVVLAHTLAQARELVARGDLRLDAAVLVHRLPDGDARTLVAALAKREPGCSAFVLVDAGDSVTVARDYMLRGAFRLARRPVPAVELAVLVGDTVHHTFRWRRALGQADDGAAAPAVVPDFDHAAQRLRHIAGLSPTETVVARWMLEGLRDAQIARKLGRAERTAKRHVSQVLAKAGVENRASLWAVLSQDGQAREREDDEDDEDDDRAAAWAWPHGPQSDAGSQTSP